MSMTQKITAIVKPTHECNLACRYCYVDEKAESGRMDSETLELTIERLIQLESIDSVSFIWHGGEPLLMGLDFFQHAVDVQKALGKNKEILNSIQTNATLISERVVDFCQANGFTLGTSLDGPANLHNLTRVYPDGSGSFSDAWSGICRVRNRNQELKETCDPNSKPQHLGGGVIMVLNRTNIDKLDEAYTFFKANNVPIKINAIFRSGKARNSFKELGISPHEFGTAMVSLFDKWFYESEQGISIAPLKNILENLITEKPTYCVWGPSCTKGFLSIGPRGDVYPCGRFDGIKDYWLGNIHSETIVQCLDSKPHKFMASRTLESVKGCASCRYGNICHAGCMHDAYIIRGNLFDKDYFCRAYKMIFKHLENALDDELKRAVVKST